MNEWAVIVILFLLSAVVVGYTLTSVYMVRKYARRCRIYANFVPAAEVYWAHQPDSPEKRRIEALIKEMKTDLDL